ncbi:MAG: hypothetical protein HYX40_11730 [Sphingobacteriales bacterium]|nr:hypothetical protein [Sphingobacteriales bacterium]
MPQENFSPEQSLQVIQRMINLAKNRVSENGHLYLFWGWVIFACSILQFIVLQFNLMDHSERIWMLSWAGIIYQVFYIIRTKKKEGAKTYTSEITGYIWLAFAPTVIIISMHIAKNHAWYIFSAIIPVLYATPTFLSGVVLRFKPLIAGGIACWLLSITSLFVPLQYHLLLLAIAVFVAWIIPGYILKKQFQSPK